MVSETQNVSQCDGGLSEYQEQDDLRWHVRCINVSAMRRDILILLFAALAATTGPAALHFYNKSTSLQEDVGAMQSRLRACSAEALTARSR
jgi:hypothetical protein